MNRNYTLEREKAEMRRKLEELQKASAGTGQMQNNTTIGIQR
jgi:hypothetical protein